MIALLTLFLATVFIIIVRCWHKWNTEDAIIGIINPPTLPILGNLLDLWNSIRNNKEYLKFLEYARKYGDTFRLRLGPKLMICTRNVKVMEVLANDPKFMKSDEYKFYEVWWGKGLILRNGENWQKFRKLITSAFHFQILERFIPIFEEHTDILIEKIHQIGSASNDVLPILHSFSLDIIAETAMGIKLNSQTEGYSKFVKYNTEIAKTIYSRVFNSILMNDWIWRLLGYHRRQKFLLAYVHGFVNDIIEKRREVILNSQSEVTGIDVRERPVFLDLLLKSEMDGKPLSNEDIRSETMTFMFAGHETTATTLGFLLYCIAKYPNVEKKLYQEIHEIYFNSVLTLNSLNAYKYLDCVIRETLRLFPITSITIKKRSEDLRIENLLIPKNVTVVTLVLASHMNEKHFPNPEKFLPERFDQKITASMRNPYAYQPFSAGLRNCIGQRFAMLELKIAAIKILSKFEIYLLNEKFEVDLIQANTMTSKTGIPLLFKERI